MKLAEQEWEKCSSCGRNEKIIRQETYGCDNCLKTIDMNKKGVEYLDVAIFSHTKNTEHRQYCSWKCCINDLRSVKTDYFISLPFLTFDAVNKGMRAQDFFKLVKK